MPVEVAETTLVRPRDLADAVARLAADRDLHPLGGGTAVVPAVAARDGVVGPSERNWLAVARLPELTSPVQVVDGLLTFGAATTLRTLELDPLVRRHAPVLAAAVASVAGPAVRNRATIGGSLALGPRSPDPITALVALDARLDVARHEGLVDVALAERRPGDLIVGVRIGVTDGFDSGGWAYRRFTMRGAADRPIATIAVAHDGPGVRIALGAAIPVVRRLIATEAAFERGEDVMAAAAAELDGLPVVGDDRASAAFRRRVVAILVGRAVSEAIVASAEASA